MTDKYDRELKARTPAAVYMSFLMEAQRIPVLSMFTQEARRSIIQQIVDVLPTHDHAPAPSAPVQYEYSHEYTLTGEAWYTSDDWTTEKEAKAQVDECREDPGFLEVRLIRQPIVRAEVVDY